MVRIGSLVSLSLLLLGGTACDLLLDDGGGACPESGDQYTCSGDLLEICLSGTYAEEDCSATGCTCGPDPELEGSACLCDDSAL